MKSFRRGPAAALAALLLAALATRPADAHGHGHGHHHHHHHHGHGRGGFSIGIGIGLPVVRPAPYYRPYPVYVAPAPVVVSPPPVLVPQPVVVQPSPVVQQVPVATQAAPAQAAPAQTAAPQTLSPSVVATTANSAEPAEVERHLQLLTHPDERVRADAVLQIGRLRSEAAADRVAATLAGDRSPTVRESAARALGLIGSPRSLAALRYAAQADPDRDVRRSAQFSVEIITSR